VPLLLWRLGQEGRLMDSLMDSLILLGKNIVDVWFVVTFITLAVLVSLLPLIAVVLFLCKVVSIW